jgi:hypothetical protein
MGCCVGYPTPRRRAFQPYFPNKWLIPASFQAAPTKMVIRNGLGKHECLAEMAAEGGVETAHADKIIV